ncbi:TadE/TadG family type IV pilus assembly protein [Methylobacterium oryzihabitans]|uniref:Pilus assembly protein n=1 Tax=Methylobacterium oryzihabitans TaxID=2499852 RepID=A0A3S2YLB9_9HYPH|nr:TadE/TadG family type IV pilus assembly protein [Methylobacterium oryzihabitans]RVU13742.1 pilus assembly protein [Methylobacterium oryzihabitans]
MPMAPLPTLPARPDLPGRPRLLRAALGRGARRFRRADDGVAAVEFALISIPFLALVGAIFETALGFFASQNLEIAVSDTARQIYTGQFQGGLAAGSSADQALANFKILLCRDRVTIFPCGDVKVDVLALPDNRGIAITGPIDPATGDWRAGFGTRYQAPEDNQIVVVQAAVAIPAFFSLLNPSTYKASQGRSRIIQTAVAFRTEPYK